MIFFLQDVYIRLRATKSLPESWLRRKVFVDVTFFFYPPCRHSSVRQNLARNNSVVKIISREITYARLLGYTSDSR